MSQKELNAYYKTHQPKPTFYQYDTLGHAVFYAHAGQKDLPLLLFIHGAPGRWYGYINYLSDSSLLQNFHAKSRNQDTAVDPQTVVEMFTPHRPS